MARARNIKPGLYKNEDLAECSVWARYLFPGLWMLADREGRLEDRPKRIKGELLPFDSQDVEPLLKELAARGFLLRYQIAGVSFIQISKFKDHQTPHYTEKPSAIKPPILQETEPHIEPLFSRSEASIKRGPLPPDSLIHRFTDSPIPDSSVPSAKASGTGGKPPKDAAKDEIWRTGKTLLEIEGKSRESAGSYLGKLVKDYGQKLVLDAVRDCVAASPAKPSEWLVARCQERRQPTNKQEALERRNAEAVSRFLGQEEPHASH